MATPSYPLAQRPPGLWRAARVSTRTRIWARTRTRDSTSGRCNLLRIFSRLHHVHVATGPSHYRRSLRFFPPSFRSSCLFAGPGTCGEFSDVGVVVFVPASVSRFLRARCEGRHYPSSLRFSSSHLSNALTVLSPSQPPLHNNLSRKKQKRK